MRKFFLNVKTEIVRTESFFGNPENICFCRIAPGVVFHVKSAEEVRHVIVFFVFGYVADGHLLIQIVYVGLKQSGVVHAFCFFYRLSYYRVSYLFRSERASGGEKQKTENYDKGVVVFEKVG